MRRRLFFIFLGVVAGLVVIVTTVPLWLGAAAKMIGRSRGLTFGSYERIGYTQFALRDVEYRRPGLRVTATRAHAETPLAWWWHHARGQPGLITVGDWRVEVSRRETPGPPAPDRGWMRLRSLLQRIATQLERWLPRAAVGAGVVQWPGAEISVGSAKWAGRQLVLDDVAYRALKVDGTVEFAPNDTLQVAVRMDDGTAATKLQSVGADVKGELMLWEQPATVSARFDSKGWLPPEAAIDANSWSVPGSRLKLGAAYATVRATGRVEWRTDRILTAVEVTGDPAEGKAAPPLHVRLKGNGDWRAFTVESLSAALPGIDAELNAPVTVERSGRFRETGAQFSLQADLAKVPWFSATGTVKGEARLTSGITASPAVEFSFSAHDVSAREIALSAVTARGRLDCPRLQILEGSIAGGEGERLALKGGWDIRAKELLPVEITGEIRRESLARWLPKQPEFNAIKINAEAAGPIAEIKHRGTAQIDAMKVQGVSPLAVAVKWQGRGALVDDFKVEASAGASRIEAGGSVDPNALKLTTLEFHQADVSRLHLAGPATLHWRPAVRLESFRVTGSEANLTASGTAGATGRIEIAARNISSKWFSDFVATPGPELSLSLLALVGIWDQGPMSFLLTLGAGVDLGEGRSASINVSTRGDKDGLKIEALRATEVGETVVDATGRLPIVFSPGTRSPLRIDPEGVLVLDASVAPNSAFWRKLADLSGVELQDPSAAAKLTGTWQRPEGTASLKAARITINPKKISRPLPAIESLDVLVTAEQGGVTLSRFTMQVEGQRVRAAGRLPVPEGEWGSLIRQPLAAAKRGADFKLEIPDAEIAAFSRFLPTMLAPTGRIQADMRYTKGGIEGVLKLRDAASRPLGPLGVLQEISADIALSGRTLELHGVTAKSGGQPIVLSGTAELPESGAPRFNLTLKGDNLPFVRQTGLLLRGDLDLKLQTPENAPPRLSGNVRLRDSLFLSDIRSFLPKGGASASRRPPYFAIETPPVNSWTLAVDVTGEEFLRLRTPVFTGVASARFRLGGTLGEPRAIGEIAIDEGNVRMPFASFAVTQGSVRLTEADPYEPSFYLRGAARRYGYDLTMEIEGSSSQPNVVFTSSPALDSEQVLLMVMTGAAPRNEVTNSSTQRVANIGLYLGQSLLASLGANAGDADRLTVSSGEKVTPEGDPTLDVEYKLSDRWTLTVEKDEFDEYNAGVKWRAFRGERAKGSEDHAKK
jgi:translocation and assembly module TamB